MKNFYLLLTLMMLSFAGLQAQETLEDYRQKKSEVKAEIDAKNAELAELKSQLDSYNKEIEKLSGWMLGFGGNIGLGINESNNWIAAPNPNSHSSRLAVGLSGYANRIKEKTIWRNSAFLTKEWQDIDKNGEEEVEDNLFDNGITDLFNMSSLFGYRINSKLAATAMGELNTSIENFLTIGTADIGAGLTWTPTNNFVLIVHPLNYHFVFSGYDNVANEAALGAKLRAEYNKKFSILNQNMTFSSTLTSFIPYNGEEFTITSNDPDAESWTATLFEYTWINNLAFDIFKGVGVGIGFGLRNSGYESPDLQSYYSLGLTYTL